MAESQLPYKIVNILYKINYNLYKHLYFIYKRISDKNEIKQIEKFIKPGMTVVDVGANIGFYTLLLSDLVGRKGRVYSFEPEKSNFNHLKKMCRNRHNVILNNLAVGEKDETINLYISNQLNVDHLTYNSHEKRRIVPIKSISLDKYFSNKEPIDFILVDTQGFDYYVLKGSINVLKHSNNIAVISEFCPYDLRRAGVSSKTFLSFLKKMGFHIHFLNPNYKKILYGKNRGRMSYVNILASKNPKYLKSII